MGTIFKLECRHCGTQFIHSAESNYGMQPVCIGCGEEAQNQDVIRCPGCQRLIVSTASDLRDQILEETNWD